MNALKDAGIYEKTALIFTSKHGNSPINHAEVSVLRFSQSGLHCKAPVRAEKQLGVPTCPRPLGCMMPSVTSAYVQPARRKLSLLWKASFSMRARHFMLT